MRILKIPYSLVAADVAAEDAATRGIDDSPQASSCTRRFGAAHHCVSDILPIVPENPPFFTHCDPPWTPYSYTLWHTLIARSQGLQGGECHEVIIPGFLYEDMMKCHSAWVTTGRIHNAVLENLLETLKSTKAGQELVSLLDGERKWFIRLDHMSPKDSPMGGVLPSLTLRDAMTKLCTSMRTYSCLQYEKVHAEKEERNMEIKLVLNRWHEGMDPGREFRVFVSPPAAAQARITNHPMAAPRPDDFKISAISQYRWTMHGFSFDVALEQDGTVQLVEINPFGALSPCGACLFNWIRDGKVLYGIEEAQFAVTLDEARP
ncbi:hypothetical protein J3E72DRAFT_182069 [Bipolaris maydis]|nr:hypothetical protein J3E72DRAFT_182069 [Bipolaris maydis]